MPTPLKWVTLREAGDWPVRAACAGSGHHLFFGLSDHQVQQAKAVCAGCDVRAECLSYAMDNDEQFGVWGGMTVGERRSVRQWRRVAG